LGFGMKINSGALAPSFLCALHPKLFTMPAICFAKGFCQGKEGVPAFPGMTETGRFGIFE